MVSLHYSGTHIQHRLRVGIMLWGIFLALCGASAQQLNPTSGSFAQIVAGAGITTTITLVNTGGTSAQVHLRFLTDEGDPLIMPVMLSQSGVSGSVDSVDQTISPNASLNIEIGNLTDLSLKVGSAHLASDGRVNGFVIFHIAGSGQEPIVQLETRASKSYLFPFDESTGSATGVAITNTTTSAVDVSVIAHTALSQVALGTVTLSALGHAAFVLDQRFPATRLLSGLIEFPHAVTGANRHNRLILCSQRHSDDYACFNRPSSYSQLHCPDRGCGWRGYGYCICEHRLDRGKSTSTVPRRGRQPPYAPTRNFRIWVLS
jgi:hypothetical protein